MENKNLYKLVSFFLMIFGHAHISEQVFKQYLKVFEKQMERVNQ